MKRLVNGKDVSLDSDDALVRLLDDRLMVNADGKTASAVAIRDGDTVHVSYMGRQFTIERPGRQRSSGATAHSGALVAPIPGIVVAVLVEQGQIVVKGERLIVVEAMKVQQGYAAPFDGVVVELNVAVGDQLVEGQLLANVAPRSPEHTESPGRPSKADNPDPS